jgi:hypothetical protein
MSATRRTKAITIVYKEAYMAFPVPLAARCGRAPPTASEALYSVHLVAAQPALLFAGTPQL